MADWPITLPQVSNRSGFSEQEKDNVLRSTMGYGPDQLRQRTTCVIRQGTRSFYMTDAQRDTLDEFYAANKTLPWDWDDQTGKGVRSFRFMAPPAVQEVSCDLHAVSIQIEIVP